MPSLQQISLKECTSSSTADAIGTRNMSAGPDILQNHSINSLLAEQNDIVNRVLASPIEGETISFPDLFGNNGILLNGGDFAYTNGSNNNSSNGSSMRGHQMLNVHQNMPAGSGLFAKSNIQQPCNNNNSNNNLSGINNFNNHQSVGASTATSPNGGGGLASSRNSFMQSLTQGAKTFDGSFSQGDSTSSNNMLKVLQRNLSFECNSPTSPSTPSSYGASSNVSPLLNNGFNGSSHSFDSSLLSNNSNSSFSNSITSLSASPTDYNENMLSSLENHNLFNQMNYLTFSNLQQLQQSQINGGSNSGNSSPMSPTADFEFVRMQNLQALNALCLLQSSQQNGSNGSGNGNLDSMTLNHLLQNYNWSNQYRTSLQIAAAATAAAATAAASATKASMNITSAPDGRGGSAPRPSSRDTASLNEPKCTWSGVLPPRTYRNFTYSPKVFLGGVPWDINEQALIQIFKQFGPIKVEWPGKDQQSVQPRGYAYIIFESDRQVQALLQACTPSEYSSSSSSSGSFPSIVSNNGNYYFKVSSKKIKSKDVEVIPWIIHDSNFVKSASQKYEPTKTVFVGALHGKLTAEGLATIMNDLFDGVVYAGLDTDKYKYPIGSGRVTFNNSRSYMRAVSAGFIEIKSAKFTKKVQVDPYLEDSICSRCGLQHGLYFCREMICFRYFCRTCWQEWHNEPSFRVHKPLTRNSKSSLMYGPASQCETPSATSPTTPQSLRPASFKPSYMKRQ